MATATMNKHPAYAHHRAAALAHEAAAHHHRDACHQLDQGQPEGAKAHAASARTHSQEADRLTKAAHQHCDE